MMVPTRSKSINGNGDGGSNSAKKVMNRGAWTAEEDRKLSQYIETHGAKRWKTIATKSGLNRCGKSCRLRWLNYLRPNIKRGNISDEEEDLILRLHRLLGNRWSLIAGRLPGRTDNEIKNYWNSHLSKKLVSQREKDMQIHPALSQEVATPPGKTKTPENSPVVVVEVEEEGGEGKLGEGCLDPNFDVEKFFNFSTEASCGLEWANMFMELEGDLMMDDRQ
ncbi:hypothetical protein SAY87_015108 [Trapa incisa]|uniref:Uncharacterized protein n=1 Tax=Trapa incisa TaxID=236973 RepID=A0AAN7JL62_9MYRT|nr:hypothetical protein SAY87_015108 [Trapa incisa]